MQFVTKQDRPHILLRGAKWLGVGAVCLLALIGLGVVLRPAPATRAAPVQASVPRQAMPTVPAVPDVTPISHPAITRVLG